MKIKRKRKLKKASKPAQQAQTQSVRRVISPATIPYQFWKQWNKARTRGEYELLYQMSHPEGPFLSPFESPEQFIKHARIHPLPLGAGWELNKIKLDETLAYLLSSRGIDDPGIRIADVELMKLSRTRDGWRLFEVQSIRKTKARGEETFFSFDDFGIPSAELEYKKKVDAGYVRPDLADYPAEEEAEEEGAAEVSEVAAEVPSIETAETSAE